MSFSPLDSQIYASLFRDEGLAHIFSDEHTVQTWLQVEIALAQVQAGLGLIPSEAAQAIANNLPQLQPDFTALQAEVDLAGVPIIGLLKQARAQLPPKARPFLHWGATTQDIMDTALVLQLQQTLIELERKLIAVCQNLAHLAKTHRYTLMAGRTHAQQALPIPFGFKVATWLAPLLRHQQRLQELKPRLLVLQFGGAVGTLSALGADGPAVQRELAKALQLNLPPMAWHSQRDNVAECASWLTLLSGSLAKMAQDIILMAQSEVGELRESADVRRGGSSTMPQKSNPIISEVVVAVHRQNSALLSAIHQAMVQEHERGTHGWQVEWLSLPQMLGLTATALNKSQFLSQNLYVQTEIMTQNVANSQGLMLAEALSFALSQFMPRSEAKAILKQAALTALAQQQHLVDVLKSQCPHPLDWDSLGDERQQLAQAQNSIDQVLAQASQMTRFDSAES